MATDTTTENGPSSSQEAQTHVNATTEYCAKTQELTWQYYWGGAMQIVKAVWLWLRFIFSPCNFPVVRNYQAPTGTPWPAGQPTLDARYGYNYLGICAPDHGYSDRAADDSWDTASWYKAGATTERKRTRNKYTNYNKSMITKMTITLERLPLVFGFVLVLLCQIATGNPYHVHKDNTFPLFVHDNI